MHTVSLNICDYVFSLKGEDIVCPQKVTGKIIFFYYILQLIILESRQNYHFELNNSKHFQR